MGQLNRNLTLDGSSDFRTMEQDIKDAIGEINRQGDMLDSLDSGLKIIARGSVTLTPSGTNYTPQTVNLNAGLATSFMCYMQRSDQPTRMYFVPYLEATGAVGSVQARLETFAYVFNTGITFSAEAATDYVSPPTLTFFYYMIQQPANPATT